MSSRGQWPDTFLSAIEADGPPDGVDLWWLGGAGFALRASGLLLWIDPFFGPSPSERALRMIASPIGPGAIRRADAALSTHDHIDHCEPDTLIPLAANTPAVFIGPRSSADKMRQMGIAADRIRQVSPGDTIQMDGLRLHVCPCRDLEEPHAVTFLVEAANRTIFFGGDGRLSDDHAPIGRRWEIDLAVVSIGAELYMSPEEGLRCAEALRARTVMPVHWDIWKHFRGRPEELAELAAERCSGLRVLIPSLGDRFSL